MENLDYLILNWIGATLHGTWITSLFYGITVLGNGGMIWLLLSGWMAKKDRKKGLIVILTLLITFVLVELVIKNVVQRPRPFETHSSIIPAVITPKGYSFPSGHTSTSFSCAAMIADMDKNLGRPALIIATLIGLSRLILCVHYPSDVIAGALIGITIEKSIKRGMERMINDENNLF